MTSDYVVQLPGVPLPTLDSLNATLPLYLDVPATAKTWFDAFSKGMVDQNVGCITDLLISTSVWRDLLSLTWDFRILQALNKVASFLQSQLPVFHPQEFTLREESISLEHPYQDLAWINLMFDFRTNVGICSGVARLVPTQTGEWKAHAVLTCLEELFGFPEKIGPRRNLQPNHGLWEQQRKKEWEFEGVNPAVLVIGAGQSGLIMAARLRALDVSVLVVDKNARVGDNWRTRYDALSLHDPVWADHMPYMPFPSTWPVFAPSLKFAGWLENYADSLEIPVWNSSTITGATQDENGSWHVGIIRGDGSERKFIVNHIIFATGLGGGAIKSFEYPGLKDAFKGEYLHSTQHKRALDHAGKKVVVVGSGTSAHDIARDYYEHGVDVTMVQRGPTHVMSANPGWELLYKKLYWEGAPPTDTVDRLIAAFPRPIAIEFFQRRIKELAELDKDLLDGLRKVGFKLSDGVLGCGFFVSFLARAGGYYIDVGASQLIIDRKIKLKNDSTISEVTETGLKFTDGSELPADVIVFSTGAGDARGIVRSICGDVIADKTKALWGLNSEGEINSVWRDTGVTNMCLAMTRFHSKQLALQIKAIEEGMFGERHSLKE
ncbi:putative indole-3-pyruvate monooxygenase YUCCA11 [Leucoagaricus sp. SymC.cos]|nr:putative indole-3-pyruvate monooxygenase YUCCA11 [Leucoagaricus sp. SymC.cos]